MRFSNVLFFFILIIGCSSEVAHSSENTSPHSSVDQNQKTDILRLKRISVIDKQGTGGEAFSFLVPVDWIVDADVYWLFDNPGMPANAYVKAKSPDGDLMFEAMPVLPFFWTSSQFSLSMNPPGSVYAGHRVAQPVNALDGLTNIVLPTYRKNVQNLQIIDRSNMPELVKSIATSGNQTNGLQHFATGAKLKLNYTLQNQLYEEELYGISEGSTGYVTDLYQGQVSSTFWYLEYLYAFTAAKGKLEPNRKTFEIIIQSFKMNKQWFNTYMQVVQMLINQNMQAIYQAGQISRIISQTNNEISQIITDSYWQRQSVNEKVANNFSQYIRGTANYIDKGKIVELPDYYNNVWSNGNGEYILSNGNNYDPNKLINGNWQRIERK
jgi:hypothetical protein